MQQRSELEGNRKQDAPNVRTITKSLVVLAGVTMLGFQIAEWTRFDKLPSLPFWLGSMMSLCAHVFVLGTWTYAWLLFWKQVLYCAGDKWLGLGVPCVMAVIAEGSQRYLPGHIPDFIGLVYNVAGVRLAWACFSKRLGESPMTSCSGVASKL